MAALESDPGRILSSSVPPSNEAILAFASRTSSIGTPCEQEDVSKFIKNLDDIPEIVLPPALPCRDSPSLLKGASGTVHRPLALSKNSSKMG